jgi:hypothetical protein
MQQKTQDATERFRTQDVTERLRTQVLEASERLTQKEFEDAIERLRQ